MHIDRPHRALGILAVLLAVPLLAAAQIRFGVSINVAPPALPVYLQPAVPGPGYLWAPGYWAWGPQGYYWVPGTWVLAPAPGLLWTPGYWGWGGGAYLWHAGYWGPHVGFYGGVNYGFGFGGHGFEGGYWNGGRFYYNAAVVNVGGAHLGYVYSRPVMAGPALRTSFNGGPGGIAARPDAQEQIAARESHVAATRIQLQHENHARTRRELLASVNHGVPRMAANARAAQFSNPQRSQRNAARPGPGGQPRAPRNRRNSRPPAHSPRGGRPEQERHNP